MMNYLLASSRLKVKPGEVTIDPILSGVAHIRKRIGDRVYEAFEDARLVGEDYIQCFPDSPPTMDPRPIPLPDDWTPRTTRNIRVGEYNWNIPEEDFEQLEWLTDEQWPSVL